MRLHLITLISVLVLSGCATSTYTVGKDFSTSQVDEIERYITTKEDLQRMFGTPFSKSVVSSNQEKWLYTYTVSTATAKSYVVAMDVDTESYQKVLDVLIEDGFVVNYTFTETTNPSVIQTR